MPGYTRHERPIAASCRSWMDRAAASIRYSCPSCCYIRCLIAVHSVVLAAALVATLRKLLSSICYESHACNCSRTLPSVYHRGRCSRRAAADAWR
jgi:hypothetical protein